jgi:hypothetical protein
MSPQEFTFKLTVPNDPEGATVVAVVAGHAVEYANIDAAAGPALVERVRTTAAEVLTSAPGYHSLVVFTAGDGKLTVTIGPTSVSHPLPV